MLIIGDHNYQDFVGDQVIDGELKTRGLLPRDWTKDGYGSIAKPFDIPYIPQSEWRDRIEEQERNKSAITHLCDLAGLRVKDQNGTYYCWINATIHAMEIARVVAGMPFVELSPASVGAPIKGYRNEGGWGTEGLKYVIQHGAVPSSMWPNNAISQQYDTAATRAERAKYKVTEWMELPAGDFNALATCLLLNMPVSAGYNWWGHQITCVRLVWKDQWLVEIDNSWGAGWGTNGRGHLTVSKATPSDIAVAPLNVIAA